MIFAILAIVATTANAQNTLRKDGTFTLQSKVGLGIVSLSGNRTSAYGIDRKSRCGLAAGVEGEYQNIVLDIRYNISVSKANKHSDSDHKFRSDLMQFTLGYKFKL